MASVVGRTSALMFSIVLLLRLVAVSFSFWETPGRRDSGDANVTSFKTMNDHVTTGENSSGKFIHYPFIRSFVRFFAAVFFNFL